MSASTQTKKRRSSVPLRRRSNVKVLAWAAFVILVIIVQTRNKQSNVLPMPSPTGHPTGPPTASTMSGDTATRNESTAQPDGGGVVSQQLPVAVVVVANDTIPTIVTDDSPQPKDLLKDEILPRLERIQKICGPLCEVTSKEELDAVTVPNTTTNHHQTLLPQVRVPMNCKAIMESEDMDASDSTIPYPIPNEIEHFYSLNGAIRIINLRRHVRNVYMGKRHRTKWSEHLIDKIIREIKEGVHVGSYSTNETTYVRDHLNKTGKIPGSRVLVIGSEKPWLEATCLLLGATNVVTLEYGTIVSTHPNIQTLTPPEFRNLYINGTLGQFDTVVSFSSIEHSGLGRYGDALNPWGDLLAVARAWCVTKPGGALALGVPSGMDAVEFNAHRVYGKIRWPLITANWIQIDSALQSIQALEHEQSQDHPLMVFEKVG